MLWGDGGVLGVGLGVVGMGGQRPFAELIEYIWSGHPLTKWSVTFVQCVSNSYPASESEDLPTPWIIRKFKISCRWKFKVLYWKQDPQTSLSRTLQRFLQLRIHGKAAKMSPVLLWIYFKKTFSISIIFPRTKKSIPGAQNWSSNISAEQYFQKYFLNLVWLLWSALTEIASGLG